ncbi:MAG: hypothetical protein JOZ85_15565 [Betaproteobacteria bacterium]|nr:hypothetical protein [Betaproteobacteria bacterium]
MLAFQGRMLKRAAEICGGYNALCVRLGVSEFKLRAWLEAKATMPEHIFLKAADIVLDDDIKRAAQDRRLNPRIPPANDPSSVPQVGHA